MKSQGARIALRLIKVVNLGDFRDKFANDGCLFSKMVRACNGNKIYDFV